MMIGDTIPNITLKNDEDQEVDLGELAKGRILIVFFYPKDDTRGCTREACSFRDNYESLVSSGAEVVGISRDSVQSHTSFRAKHGLPFPLLSDKKGVAKNAFGVKGMLFGLIPGRETFVFDEEGVLRHHFSSMTKAKEHVDSSLEAVKRIRRSRN